MKNVFIVFFPCVLILLCAVIAGIGYRQGVNDTKREAVKAGCAYYETDRKTGESIYKWAIPAPTFLESPLPSIPLPPTIKELDEGSST